MNNPLSFLVEIEQMKAFIEQGMRSYSKGWVALSAGICMASFAIQFVAFFPGGLCTDTVGTIRFALLGRFNPSDPPVIQWITSLHQMITPSQWPLLFSQLFTYFLGVFLIAFYFVKRGYHRLSLFCLLIAWIPTNIFLSSIVIKDVAVANLWLLTVGICAHLSITNCKWISICLTGLALLCAFMSVLLRDNTFVAFPALLALIFFSHKGLSEFMKRRFVIAFIILFVSLPLSYLGMRLINGVFLGEIENRDYKSSYFEEQVCLNDLLGVSVRLDHQGITSFLSEDLQESVERSYYDSAILILRYRTILKLKEQIDFLDAWKKMLQEHPDIYFQHRTYIFSRLFDGNRRWHLLWFRQADPHAYLNHLGFLGEKVLLFETPEPLKNNGLYRSIRSYVDWYFDCMESSIHFLFLSLILILRTLVNKLRGRSIATGELIGFWALTTAVIYVAPMFFMLQHAETRYAYPSLLLMAYGISFYLIPISTVFPSRSKPGVFRLNRIPRVL